MGAPSTSYSDLVRAVAELQPSELLTTIAATSARQFQRGLGRRKDDVDRGVLHPWALTEIARIAVAHGNDRTGRWVTLRDVERLCSRYFDLDDPFLHDGLPNGDFRDFLVRTGFEQFDWQTSKFEEVGRAHALFRAAASPSEPLLSGPSWASALGCSIEQFVTASFVLHVWAAKHEGRVDLTWLDGPQFEDVLDRLPRDVIEHVADLLTHPTFRSFRTDEAASVKVDMLEEHSFNPFTARPFLRRGAELVTPHPLLVLSRGTTTGLYYDRCREKGFTDQLGRVFERYVGMQLGEIPGVVAIPEIEYVPGKRSVDWIVVTPAAVVLIEVKATRLRQLARMGVTDALDEDLRRTVTHAHEQIERTAALIRDRHTGFEAIPTDRPVLGVVATLEHYWLVGSELTPAPAPDGAKVPIVLASIREVEHLVDASVEHSLDEVVKRLVDSGEVGANVVRGVLNDLHVRRRRNRLLTEGWDAWASILSEETFRSTAR